MQRKLIALAVASMTCAVAFAERPVSIHNRTAGVPKMSKAQEKRTRRMLARHKGRK